MRLLIGFTKFVPRLIVILCLVAAPGASCSSYSTDPRKPGLIEYYNGVDGAFRLMPKKDPELRRVLENYFIEMSGPAVACPVRKVAAGMLLRSGSSSPDCHDLQVAIPLPATPLFPKSSSTNSAPSPEVVLPVLLGQQSNLENWLKELLNKPVGAPRHGKKRK